MYAVLGIQIFDFLLDLVTKTINECNTLIRARGCMDFNHSCWSCGWGGMILPSLVASPLVWQNHTTPPARPAEGLKSIQPTLAHQCIVHT